MIATKGSPMMHAFSLTDAHVVLFDLPVVFDLQLASSGASFPYRWDDDHPPRLGVFPRGGAGADVRWLDIDPCYVFHPVNAFEAADSIVIDLVRYDKVFVSAEANGPDEYPPVLERWTVDLAAERVRRQQLQDRPLEFPRIDDRRTGRRYRFAYLISAGGGGAFDGPNELVRLDIEGGGVVTCGFGAHRAACEMVFVPRPGGESEDDGVLVGFVHDLADETTELQVIDAASLESIAVEIRARIPVGFHGSWMPDS
jgi:carotenoid cleavage dioxygenase